MPNWARMSGRLEVCTLQRGLGATVTLGTAWFVSVFTDVSAFTVWAPDVPCRVREFVEMEEKMDEFRAPPWGYASKVKGMKIINRKSKPTSGNFRKALGHLFIKQLHLKT